MLDMSYCKAMAKFIGVFISVVVPFNTNVSLNFRLKLESSFTGACIWYTVSFKSITVVNVDH